MKVFRPAGYYASHPHKRAEFHLLQLATGTNPVAARQAADQLITCNQGFLKKELLQWRMKGFKFDFDELFGEAMIAFYEAIIRYDYTRDVSIRTYSRFYLLKLRRRFFRKSRWVEFKPEYIDGLVEVDNDEGECLILTEVLSGALQTCLTPVEREILVLHFMNKLKKRRIACLRGCSERRIGVVISNALPKLKAYLERRGISPALFASN